jgi:hypothetical protein
VDTDRGPLLDFGVLAGRLAAAALALGAVVFIAVVVEGLREGLTFGLMGRWLAVFVVAFLVAAALVTGGHALAGALRVRRRGGRLKSDGVGFLPPRRRREED